jgi:hypothetical protein
MPRRPRCLYSTSALRVAQRLFTVSTTEPTDLVLRREDLRDELREQCGDDVGAELPAGRMLLRPLRDLLLRPDTSRATRDAVWRELIRRARADRGTWVVMALGMAMPGLRREVRALLVDFSGDRDDLESAVAEGFVTALYRVDPAEPWLCSRLVRAGRKAGVKQAYQDAAAQGASWSEFASCAPRAPWGHPDFVLVDAIRAGVLSRQEAWLIGVTRLEHVPVAEVAALTGERSNTVVVRRHRAEHRVQQAIADGLVSSGSDLGPADAAEVVARPPTINAGDPTRAGVWARVGRCEPAGP